MFTICNFESNYRLKFLIETFLPLGKAGLLAQLDQKELLYIDTRFAFD